MSWSNWRAFSWVVRTDLAAAAEAAETEEAGESVPALTGSPGRITAVAITVTKRITRKGMILISLTLFIN
jgi:hypothetical protein